jgi:PAS domain S-box-containing protein
VTPLPAGIDPLDAQRVQLIQLIANTLPALLAYIDEEGRYLWVNEAYRTWLGQAPESLRGRHVREVVGEAGWTAVEPYVKRVLAGEPVSFESHFSAHTGRECDVRVAYFPDRDAGGRVRGYVAFVTDVSEIRSAERALRESERMLAESQAAAHVGAWEAIIDANGIRRSLRWSDETYRIFGYEPGAVAIDQALFISAVHPDDLGLIWSAGKPPGADPPRDRVEAEFRIVRPDGTVRTIQSWFITERDAAGRVTRLHGTCQDITERKLAESESRRAREHLQVVVDATPAMIARYDSDLRLVWANKHYAGRFGKRPEELMGMQLRAIIGEQAFATIEPATTRVLAGEEVDMEIDVVYPNVGRRSMHFVVSPTRDAGGAVDGCVAVITDDTQHRQVEHERERALAELQEVDRRKDEFLAMLSHELRNPMAPILSAVEILQLASTDADTATKARAVLGRQVRQLKRLLDDLLDVSRVNQGKISLHRELIDLGTVLLQAVEVSRPLLAEKKQRLSFNSGGDTTLVHADSARLVQVFGNLLNNAAKYSEPGGAIELDLSAEGAEAIVKVRDHGVGMAPDLLEHAFDLFVQEERSLDRAQGGIGIGLTMVRNLVKLHGGSVEAFSEGPGRGSEIVVRLPRAAPGAAAGDAQPAAGRAPRPPVASAARPLRILVVDDNVDAATTLAHLLTLRGHEVAVAHDGPAALATATRTRPEIVFIDIGLPGMDGYALARALRSGGLGQATLVAVTGYGRDDDLRRSRAGGFDHHLVKPVDLTTLQQITEGTGGHGLG